MERINVVLVGVTGIVSDIIKGILEEDPEVRVAAELPLDRAVAARAARAGADVVIVAADGSVRPTVLEVLAEQPRSKVLTIRDDGRTISLFELLPHETELGQVSPETLLEAVRTARAAPL